MNRWWWWWLGYCVIQVQSLSTTVQFDNQGPKSPLIQLPISFSPSSNVAWPLSWPRQISPEARLIVCQCQSTVSSGGTTWDDLLTLGRQVSSWIMVVGPGVRTRLLSFDSQCLTLRQISLLSDQIHHRLGRWLAIGWQPRSIYQVLAQQQSDPQHTSAALHLVMSIDFLRDDPDLFCRLCRQARFHHTGLWQLQQDSSLHRTWSTTLSELGPWQGRIQIDPSTELVVEDSLLSRQSTSPPLSLFPDENNLFDRWQRQPQSRSPLLLEHWQWFSTPDNGPFNLVLQTWVIQSNVHSLVCNTTSFRQPWTVSLARLGDQVVRLQPLPSSCCQTDVCQASARFFVWTRLLADGSDEPQAGTLRFKTSGGPAYLFLVWPNQTLTMIR